MEGESETRVPDLGEFRLGDWRVNQAEGTLAKDGGLIRLEPRVMDVLVYLAASPGRVVSKEDLLGAVWDGSFVEEGVLSQAVHSLRKALGDDARQPRYIQTIPKRGYRLVASTTLEVEPVQAATLAESPSGPLPATPSTQSLLPKSPREWAWLGLVIAGLMTILALLVVGRWQTEARSAPVEVQGADPRAGLSTGLGPRIVVFPFEDLGQPAEPFFSLGLTQEITKDLGSLPSLQVIYRAVGSTHQKGGKPPYELGRDLGVDYVLLGTVEWANPRSHNRSLVRIRPLLVRVDGVQVWADSFDGKVDNVFEVQTEISRRVIGSLGISLLPAQNRALREPPTKNLEAHQAYIRGLTLKDEPYYSEENLRKAALTLERAVALDPGFAAAWAELSQANSYLAYNTDPTTSRMEQARNALERAIALDPDLPEVRLARAYYTYRCQEDFDGSLAQLRVAARLFPNNAEIFKALGLLLRRKGLLAQALEALKHAQWLDPRTGELVWILPETQRALRNFEEADRGFAQAIAQAPDEPAFWEQRALARLALTGDPEQARKILADANLAGSPDIEAVVFRLDLYEGKYGQALTRLASGWTRKLAPETQARIAMQAAIARERLGDLQGALAAAEANRADLAGKVVSYPSRPLFRVCLAVALAQLGRRQEALVHAERAVRMAQSDAFSGPRIAELQALVDVILGRHQEVIDRLERLLSTPYRDSITLTDLRLDPAWWAVRGDPGFQGLLKEFEK